MKTSIRSGLFSDAQIMDYLAISRFDNQGKRVRLEIFKNDREQIVFEIYDRNRDNDAILGMVPVQRIIL